MSLMIDRRSLLQAGLYGAGALAFPGNAAALLAARGFTHDVASGEPRQHSVMLWTRYVPATGDSARLQWQVSTSPSFARIAASGEAIAESAHDFTVKPVADRLAPGRWYYYRFRDRAGRLSPVGRTRTLPDGPLSQFKLAFFSCSNIGFGWFNAYAHAAARHDLDLTVHLGDYLYEYDRGDYPSLDEAVRPGEVVPLGELIHLADYRIRYAAYRSDPDLQRLHRMFPMIAMWDDHESANDSWVGGAQNHQPETEGPWSARKAAAVQAYREWLPVSDNGWQDYDVGDLATIYRIETRLTARSKQLDMLGAARGQAHVDAALVRFRDGPWQDPARTLMGAEQERWLGNAFQRSVRRGAKWQVLAQQVVMGSIAFPPEAANWIQPNASDFIRARSAVQLAGSKVGLPFNMDDWDGYPAARRRLLKSALDANANLVVLSGDSHNAWAFDLDVGGTPAGVEFGGQSVTSPGFEHSVSTIAPTELTRELIARNRQMKWANTSQRGYVTVELTPARATGEWLFMDTVRNRSTAIAGSHRKNTQVGARRFTT
jgi:alkaline phosphatase D